MKKPVTSFLLAGLCSSLLVSGTFAATKPAAEKTAAPIQSTKPIYNWRTESEKDPNGKFDHCVVKNMYDNGTLMILAQNNAGEKRIALNFPENKMSPGQQFDLTMQVDRRDVFPVEAVAVSPQTLGMPIPEALPEQMRKGQMLHMRGPNDEVVFDLAGINGAVMSLQDCIMVQKNGGGSTAVASNDVPSIVPPVTEKTETKGELITEHKTPPSAPTTLEPITPPAPKPAEKKIVQPEAKALPEVKTASAKPLANPIPDKLIPPLTEAPVKIEPAASESTPVKPAVTASANPITKLADKIEAMQDNKIIQIAMDPSFPSPWKDVFADTAYSPDRLIPMKNQTANQPLDYIWKKDDVFLGVKAKAIAPGEDVGKMSYDYLKMLKSRCVGNFVAQQTDPQADAKKNITWRTAEAACSNSSNGDSIAAMIFTVTPQGGQVYFFEAKSAKGSMAIKARNTILNKVLQ